MKSSTLAAVMAATFTATSANAAVTDNQFNPALSVILDGGYASYDADPEDYELAGFALGGEAELDGSGFTLGHSEITLSGNIDSQFYGSFTFVLVEEEGELVTELEEAFFETTAIGNGVKVRGGKFLSSIGYQNQQHMHAWDFRDPPLIVRGLFGKHYIDDGLQFSIVAPTDLFIEFGVELLAGSGYPAGGENDNVGATTLYLNVGGDIGDSHSWQAGISSWTADSVVREYGGHAHGGGGGEEDIEFEGESDILGINAIYKWAPGGNFRQQHVKLQFEYFDREDTGDIIITGDTPPPETSTLLSKQDGWYAQAIWGFSPYWRTGIRFDALSSDNTGSDTAVLDEAGLVSGGHDPSRTSVMLEWVPSEFSRIRLQFNQDESTPTTDDQLFVQYTYSLGAHGAHAY